MQNNETENRGVLERVNSPVDLKNLTIDELNRLCEEIRKEIIGTVSCTGGHLGANLGIVEVTVALHRILNSPKDKIVWDVGHQCYVHKYLTGRKDRMATIRQTDGLSGFPNITESEHDHFNVGHASTSLSQALGLATARDLAGRDERVVALLGDGSLTGGMCYEALNNIGHFKTPMTIILNDNKMAISKSIGSMSKYLNKIWTAPIYNRVRSELEKKLEKFQSVKKFLRSSEESLKNLLVPGMVFEELGLRYFGPIDGHDIPTLLETLDNVLKLDQPCIIHVLTQKGKGYEFAEKMPHKYHSAAPFDIETGKPPVMPDRIDSQEERTNGVAYTKAFSGALNEVAEDDDKVVAITAAMPEGAGLIPFQSKFPERFFDVGIAEEHAVTFAGALARGGYKPVCAIYSTFMQRAYDQMIHDIALQNANVTICMDRAGLVGADGPTHHGVFDFAFSRNVPGSVVCSPSDENEMKRMLELGTNYDGVFTLRYPKAKIPGQIDVGKTDFEIGKGEIIKEGTDVAILSLGHSLDTAYEVAAKLSDKKVSAALVNMRFVKPLDRELLFELTKKVKRIVTIEEHVRSGGFGSAVLEFLEEAGIYDVKTKICALPDSFVEHGSRDYLTAKYRLNAESITEDTLRFLENAKNRAFF